MCACVSSPAPRTMLTSSRTYVLRTVRRLPPSPIDYSNMICTVHRRSFLCFPNNQGLLQIVITRRSEAFASLYNSVNGIIPQINATGPSTLRVCRQWWVWYNPTMCSSQRISRLSRIHRLWRNQATQCSCQWTWIPPKSLLYTACARLKSLCSRSKKKLQPNSALKALHQATPRAPHHTYCSGRFPINMLHNQTHLYPLLHTSLHNSSKSRYNQYPSGHLSPYLSVTSTYTF